MKSDQFWYERLNLEVRYKKSSNFAFSTAYIFQISNMHLPTCCDSWNPLISTLVAAPHVAEFRACKSRRTTLSLVTSYKITLILTHIHVQPAFIATATAFTPHSPHPPQSCSCSCIAVAVALFLFLFRRHRRHARDRAVRIRLYLLRGERFPRRRAHGSTKRGVREKARAGVYHVKRRLETPGKKCRTRSFSSSCMCTRHIKKINFVFDGRIRLLLLDESRT